MPTRQEQQQEPHSPIHEVEADDVDPDPEGSVQWWDCAICGCTHRLNYCGN